MQGEVPDVVLMDIHVPVMDGIEATRLIHRKYPAVAVLMLTTFGYDEYVKAALDKGAVGYLLKDISSAELLASIRAVQDGVRVISPQVLEGMAGMPRRSAESEAAPWLRELTSREKDILVLAMKGFSNEEIAKRVFLSLQTVKNYLSSIYGKLGVENRFQAMRLAMEFKIDTLPLRKAEKVLSYRGCDFRTLRPRPALENRSTSSQIEGGLA